MAYIQPTSAYEKLKQPLNRERGSKYSFNVRYMPALLAKLESMYGTRMAKFAYSRNEANASSIQAHILRYYTSEEINLAHERCVEDFQNNNKSSKPRMSFRGGNAKLENSQDFDSALYGDDNENTQDDTKKDSDWLNSIKGIDDNDTTKIVPPISTPQTETPKADSSDQYVTVDQWTNNNNQVNRDIAQTLRLVGDVSNSLQNHASRLDGEIVRVTNRIEALEQAKATIIEIKRPDLPDTIKLGVQHFAFPDLLIYALARTNIWVYGPAGTGKTTAAEQLATALNLNYYSDGKLENAFEVKGYNNAHGGYQRTQFREAYEKGGVYCGDELDGSLPSATLAMNNALANGCAPFPDNKIVHKHPDFIFVGCANTTGVGGSLEYVGRNKQDAAFNDRFAFLEWPIDEALEDHLCPDKCWLQYVRAARVKLSLNPIKGHLITPRASMIGNALLRHGLPIDKVIKATLKKGLSDTQWNQIRPSFTYQPITEVE